jgi:hypothetical protein
VTSVTSVVRKQPPRPSDDVGSGGRTFFPPQRSQRSRRR